LHSHSYGTIFCVFRREKNKHNGASYLFSFTKDGKSTKEDKDIVLDTLEKKVIKNEGGLGSYPGTQSVHYDVRGVRARWDSF